MRKIIISSVLLFVLLSTFTVALNVRRVMATNTIYILADGSIVPDSAPITREGDLYTFTDDITDSIVILKSNATINGEGHVVHGSGDGNGITLGGVSNVTVTNVTVTTFYMGIVLNASSLITLSSNTIANNIYGVDMMLSSDNAIYGNNLTNNDVGISINLFSSGNLVYDNELIGSSAEDSRGIRLYNSANNVIYGNKLETSNIGISLDYSANNTLFNNTMMGHVFAGIYLYNSNNNIFFANLLLGNYLGAYVRESSLNSFYHNNFVNSTNAQVEIVTPSQHNNWDDGYPSGGNHWSDYNGTDAYRGANQNQTGSDGIGDSPKVFDENNTDRYPLVGSFGGLTTSGENVTVYPSNVVTVIFETITAEGLTTANESTSGPEPPPGFSIGHYFDIKTTATYATRILVRIIYDDSGMTPEQEQNVRLLQMVPVIGDLNGDGKVDILDITIIAIAYNAQIGDPKYKSTYDFDRNGRIDILDMVTVAYHYGEQWNSTTGWADITQYLDTQNNVIIGETSHLSVFGVTSSA